MKGRRKRIGLFVAYPELTHVRRTIEGIMEQCKKYDYDLCVFASNVHFSFPHLNYLRGEANIFELANFDELDGVILDNVTMVGDKDSQIQKRLLERLAKYPDLPKYVLELPSEGIELVESNSEEVLREECRHVIEVHGRKKICVLTGTKGNAIAENRLSIFLDEIKKHGLEVLPEHIIYGDFYYYSGDQLAKDIGAMSAVLRYNVDAIIFTGGMAYSDRFCEEISSYVSKIAPIMRFPGEEEMKALAEGALKALKTGHWEIYE